VPGTSLAIAKARFVRPGYLAPLASEVLPSPAIAAPVVASVTLNVTTGGLEILTLWTVIWGASAAHTAFAASVGASELLGILMRVTAGLPGGPASPDGPGGPTGPWSPLQPASRARAATDRTAATVTRAFIQPPRGLPSRDRSSSSRRSFRRPSP